MRLKLTAAALALALMGTVGAMAQTTIKLLTPENNERVNAFWDGVIADYQAAHPEITVDKQLMAGDAMMAKLPTMLSSSAAPDIFFTWGGGVMQALSETGSIKDLTDDFDADGGAWRNAYSPAAVSAFSINDRVWAVPYKFTMINFYYNKTLFEQAGVDGNAIATWDDLLAAIDKLKAVGITPIALGAKDKWPVHFYWTYLALREGGGQAFTDAKAKVGDGFLSAPFVRAGELLQQLAAAEPFQRGFEAAGWGDSLTEFSDGRAAMILGFSDTPQGLGNSATDAAGGISYDQIGMFAFPSVSDGTGDPAETFGGNNGWLVYKDAKPEALDFLRFATSPENQAKYAALNSDIPVVPSAASGITDPMLAAVAERFAKSPFHQNFLDQDLGPDVGWGVVNQLVVDLVTNQVTPGDAAQQIQEAWNLQ
jgi:raffinose/stachyose/melibiose transport system substrate-binding protein